MATSLTKKGLVAVSDKIILAAQPALEMVKLFTTDFSPDPAKKGATVNIKVLSATAADFAKGSQNYVTSTNTIKHADVVLNKDKISVYTLDDLDVIEDELNPIWGSIGPTAGRAIGKAFVQDVTGLLTYSAAEATKTMSGFTLADFVKIRAQVEEANYDPADCVIILEPTTYAALIAAMPASVVGEGGVINSAILGARFGFKAIIEGPTISKASGATVSGVTPAKGVGFVVPTGAIGVVNRYKAPIKGQAGNLIEAGYAMDEETGLVIGTRVVVNQADGECSWSSEALYGAALTKQTIGEAANGAPGFVQLVSA